MQCVVFSPTPYKETAHPGSPGAGERATKFYLRTLRPEPRPRPRQQSARPARGTLQASLHPPRTVAATRMAVHLPRSPHATAQITRETHARATKPLTGVSSVLVLSISHHKDPLTGKA